VAKNKISIVEYLNSVPLAWGIVEDSLKDQFETILSTPAECADQLAGGRVDIGLIPSIEFQRIPGTKIVPGAAVASRHRVRSVLLVSELPLWRVRTVAHDKGSRTSVALAQIIFNEFYKTRPSFRPADPDISNMLATSDAALIIGDVALKFMEQNEIPRIENQRSLVRHGAEPVEIFDLMERWQVLTGLPFVFAFWAVRKSSLQDMEHAAELARVFQASRDHGLENLPAIAHQWAGRLSLTEQDVIRYLTENIHFELDADALEGLQLYYRYAAEIGALPAVPDLHFAQAPNRQASNF